MTPDDRATWTTPPPIGIGFDGRNHVRFEMADDGTVTGVDADGWIRATDETRERLVTWLASAPAAFVAPGGWERIEDGTVVWIEETIQTDGVHYWPGWLADAVAGGDDVALPESLVAAAVAGRPRPEQNPPAALAAAIADVLGLRAADDLVDDETAALLGATSGDADGERTLVVDADDLADQG